MRVASERVNERVSALVRCTGDMARGSSHWYFQSYWYFRVINEGRQTRRMVRD